MYVSFPLVSFSTCVFALALGKEFLKECKKTTRHLQKIHSRYTVVFLLSFKSALFYALLSGPYRNEMTFYGTLFLLSVLFGGFLNHLPNWRWTCLLSWRQAHFALETNTLLLGMKVLKMHLRSTCTDTHTHTAASNFQTDLTSTWLLPHGYSPTKMGGIEYSYSRLSVLHPQVIHIHAIVFSAGLNGLQVQ